MEHIENPRLDQVAWGQGRQETFEKEPIASASMAQVHRAILLNGEYVAVKVQHKNLLENIESDLSLLRWCNDMAKKIF